MGTFDLSNFLLTSKTTLDRLSLKIWEDQKLEFEQIGVNLDDREDIKELLVAVWQKGYIPYLLQGTAMSPQPKTFILECTAQNYALLSYVLPSMFTLGVNDIVNGGNTVRVLVSVNSYEAMYMSSSWLNYQHKFFEVYRKVMGVLLYTTLNCEIVDLQELNYTSVEDICLQLARHCMSRITKGADYISLHTPVSKELFDTLFSGLSDFITCEECKKNNYSSLEVRVRLGGNA